MRPKFFPCAFESSLTLRHWGAGAEPTEVYQAERGNQAASFTLTLWMQLTPILQLLQVSWHVFIPATSQGHFQGFNTLNVVRLPTWTLIWAKHTMGFNSGLQFCMAGMAWYWIQFWNLGYVSAAAHECIQDAKGQNQSSGKLVTGTKEPLRAEWLSTPSLLPGLHMEGVAFSFLACFSSVLKCCAREFTGGIISMIASCSSCFHLQSTL